MTKENEDGPCINQGAPEEQPIEYVYIKRELLRELGHTVVKTGKCQICRTGDQARDLGR